MTTTTCNFGFFRQLWLKIDQRLLLRVERLERKPEESQRNLIFAVQELRWSLQSAHQSSIINHKREKLTNMVPVL